MTSSSTPPHTNGQFTPSVTALADGRFVVTWESEDPGDGSGFCIRGRLYNADGVAAGNDFIVNTTAMSNQYNLLGDGAGGRPLRGDVAVR